MSHSTAEVLDLTHDHALPFRLQFDDHSWRQHLNSLKPLGLAILLNTCNMDTQEHYMQFCCHVTCEALYNENLVPVTNRRYAPPWSFSPLSPSPRSILLCNTQFPSNRKINIYSADVCANWRSRSASRTKRRRSFNWSSNCVHLDM